MLRCVLQTPALRKMTISIYIYIYQFIQQDVLIETVVAPYITGGKLLSSLSSLHHSAPFICPFSNQPSNHPSTQGLHTLAGYGWKTPVFRRKKSEKWYQKHQDEKYGCLCDVCEGNCPISSQSQWNLFILEGHLSDPCNPWEFFLCHWRPVTYRKKLSWIVANILKKRESLTLTMSWTFCVGYITPFQLNLVGV